MKTSINVEEGALDLMSEGNLDEPVIMLNLLKYLKEAKTGFGVDGLTGKEAYQVYGKKFAKFQPIYGGEPIWMGRVHNSIIGTDDWDITQWTRKNYSPPIIITQLDKGPMRNIGTTDLQ